MPTVPKTPSDPTADVRAKIGEIDARKKVVADEADPLRRKPNLTPEEEALLSVLDAEEMLLLGVSTNLGVLLARLNDQSPKVEKIRKLVTLIRDQAEKAATAIDALPAKISDGAGKAEQVAQAVPKALDGIDKVLDAIEAKHKP